MKSKIIRNTTLAVLASFSLALGCKKDDPTPSPTPTATTGNYTFWTQTDLGCGNISVTMDGQTQVITQYINSSTAPACGTSGCANFSLKPGTYSYSASCSGKIWNGSATITAGNCGTTKLISTGSGTQGQAIFWIQNDLGCGNISVQLNGSSGTISSYYSSSIPSCGSAGCANFSLSPGTYSYTAACSGKNWSGSITINSGGCTTMKLTL